MSIDSNQIVDVLTNPAMPGLIKIGMTTQMELEARMPTSPWNEPRA